ncbi:MAG: hypothetical protein EOM12_09540 [Verrucomicrobiae bacterium]|nr:hypothetical protein [Verrucomicrobiae bacterium]
METYSEYHDQQRINVIKSHLQAAKERIVSPFVVMLSFPRDTSQADTSRFRKNLGEYVARRARTNKYKLYKLDPRKSIVLTIFHEDSEDDKRRHYHALISLSSHLCGDRWHLHALVNPIWQRIRSGPHIYISNDFHRDLHSNSEDILDALSYIAKIRQLPSMEKNKKSYTTSHIRFLEGFDLNL